jgi:hypothetical protein
MIFVLLGDLTRRGAIYTAIRACKPSLNFWMLPTTPDSNHFLFLDNNYNKILLLIFILNASTKNEITA